jgi:hypothetical protein
MYLRMLILAALMVTLMVPWDAEAQTPYPPSKIGTVPGIRPGNRDGGYNTPGLHLQQAKLGRMRIIEVLGETRPALPAPGSDMGPVVVGGEPTKFVAPPVKANPPVAETLIVRNWWNGRFLDDSKGRRWILIHGATDWSKVDQVAGWILDSKEDTLHFLADNGRLWRLQYKTETQKVEAPAPKK